MQAEMYKIGNIGSGYLAIMAHPSPDSGGAASFANIAQLGIRQVVSLLEPSEARSLGLESEREMVKVYGMEYIAFPIADMGLPSSVEGFAKLSLLLFQQVDAGVNTLIHCRAGIGRSGLMAAGVLLHCELDCEQAFTHVSKMRGIRVPETPQQEDWLLLNQSKVADLRNSD